MSGHIFHPFDGHPVAFAGHGVRVAHEGCFADEVTVDFPSTAAATERIERQFRDDPERERLAATIALSAREAVEGARVPLDVTVRCICRSCGGRGESWAEPCGQCDGSGQELVAHTVHVSVPAGVADGARFRFTLMPGHHPPTPIELFVLVG